MEKMEGRKGEVELNPFAGASLFFVHFEKGPKKGRRYARA